MDNELKIEPDKNRLYGLLRAQKTASPQEFMRAMSPETHDIGLGQPDTLDTLFSHLGIKTDRVNQLHKAGVIEQQLLPLYRDYAEYNNKRIQTGSTLGEAQSLVPGFPTPPGMTRQQEAYGPGAPQSNGVTPGQGMSPEQLQSPTPYGTMQDSVNRLDSQRSPSLYKEGPRPSTTVPDEQGLLPPSYQARLNANMHRFSLQRSATTAREEMRSLFEDLSNGLAQEEYPGQKGHLAIALGYAGKTADPSTAAGRKLEAEASIKEAQVPYAGKQADANLQKTQAATQSSLANTQTQNTLRQARLNKLIAQSELAQEQAHLAGDMSASEIAKQRTLKFNMLKYGTASGMFDAGEQESIINSILEGTDLKATREQPTGLRKFFGLEGNGVHVGPRDTPAQAVAPTGDPMQVPGGVIMPQHQGDLMNPEAVNPNGPGAQAEPMDKKAMAKALYDRMKEGDTQTFDGVKYKKQGSKLVRVQ